MSRISSSQRILLVTTETMRCQHVNFFGFRFSLSRGFSVRTKESITDKLPLSLPAGNNKESELWNIFLYND